jgi:hypothetical protein
MLRAFCRQHWVLAAAVAPRHDANGARDCACEELVCLACPIVTARCAKNLSVVTAESRHDGMIAAILSPCLRPVVVCTMPTTYS